MKSVAIDGPSGAGKSSLAKALAKKLGYIYVDTGALYRAIGYYMLENGVDTKDAAEVSQKLSEVEVKVVYVEGVQRILLCDRDVSDFIRSENVSMAASNVSAHAQVREFLLKLQRDLARDNDVIMDGRDIGTVVLPNATIKIFLTAGIKERAKRRYYQLKSKGIESNLEDVLREMEARDYNDSHREIAPLKPAEDAVLFDTTGHTFKQSLNKLYQYVINQIK